MLVIIRPSRLKGIVRAPASKSLMQRACAAALLSGAKCTILNPGESNDDLVALAIVKSAGADVSRENGKIIIDSRSVTKGKPVPDGV
ncbi:MAG TPA: hypothetical protein VKR32_19310, partial [Puia sp.]|nr:hypothetical protein [Puia sp.]